MDYRSVSRIWSGLNLSGVYASGAEAFIERALSECDHLLIVRKYSHRK